MLSLSAVLQSITAAASLAVYTCGKPALSAGIVLLWCFSGVLLAGSAENEEAFGNMENATWGQGGFRRKRLLKICLPLYMAAAFLCLLFTGTVRPGRWLFLDVGQDCAVLQERERQNRGDRLRQQRRERRGDALLLPYLKYMGCKRWTLCLCLMRMKTIFPVSGTAGADRAPGRTYGLLCGGGEKMEPLFVPGSRKRSAGTGDDSGQFPHIGQCR